VASSGVMNAVLLASAVVPPIVVVALAWFFLRAGKRHDEREEARHRMASPLLHARDGKGDRAPDPSGRLPSHRSLH